jgi:hypothetical protein
MNTWIVEVPEQIREQLHQRALSEGKDAQAVALEILTRALTAPVEKIEPPTPPAPVEKVEPPPPPTPSPPVYESEAERYERVYRKLREEGLIVPLSDELKKMIIPGVDREEVFQEMGKAGGKPLSQIVIEQRQERHDILVYGYKRARQKIRARERQQLGKKRRSRKRK